MNAPHERIYLSPPHRTHEELAALDVALESNWLTAQGPQLDRFEAEFARMHGVSHALAVSSGTAALHLSLLALGIGPGDEVMVSTLTFAATVNPIAYLGATPVLVDSEPVSWNMDPDLLAEGLDRRARTGRLPRAVIVVHLYGQAANLTALTETCARHGVPLVEDAAESLGSTYRGRPVGSHGRAGVFSFNGNKIITTSGGGMLISDDGRLIDRARKLATQAREPVPHYQHAEIGYNYRLSNLLAAVGLAQLRALASRVEARRANHDAYRELLADLPGLAFMPEAPWGRHTRWLTALTIDPALLGVDREEIRLALEEENIESRPVFKPMHLQPVFRDCPTLGGAVAEGLFTRGLCLPSGSNLTVADRARVAAVFRARCARASGPRRRIAHA